MRRDAKAKPAGDERELARDVEVRALAQEAAELSLAALRLSRRATEVATADDSDRPASRRRAA